MNYDIPLWGPVRLKREDSFEKLDSQTTTKYKCYLKVYAEYTKRDGADQPPRIMEKMLINSIYGDLEQELHKLMGEIFQLSLPQDEQKKLSSRVGEILNMMEV